MTKQRNYSLQTITKITPRNIRHTRLKHAIISGNTRTKFEKRRDMTDTQIETLDEENKERSIRRTQTEIQDLIDCNDFDWFGTFTFDPKKIDRHNPETVKKAMMSWLNHARRKSPDLTYIVVPERHKDGAIHFHGLLGNFNGKMADSGSKWQNNAIFNVVDYPYGFTNFTAIRDKAKTANYCRKYITKDMPLTDKGKKRYWRSKNLKLPKKIYNKTLNDVFADYAHLIDMTKGSHFQNDHLETTTFTITGKNTLTIQEK